MILMVFVNDVAKVKGLPWWTYHMPAQQSGMTYVDVVFPAFLFIVGMAMPVAVRRRLEQDDSRLRLWAHILTRSLGLVVLGLIVANARKADPRFTGLSPGVWPSLGLIGAILLWGVFPIDERRKLHTLLRYTGAAILVATLVVFRRTTETGGVAWLDFHYGEILGLIGRVYLAACILYVPLRNKLWAPPVILVALTALNVASRLGMPPLQRVFPYALWIFDSGELQSIGVAGIVAYHIFFDTRVARTFRQKALLAAAYAAVLLAGGWAFAFLGISKIASTPAWCLYTSGICVVLFLLIYWVTDVRGWRRWAAFAQPAGANTLLTYLLPDLFYFTCGAAYAAWTPTHGWPGVARSVVFTTCILGLSALLTRKGIRLQL